MNSDQIAVMIRPALRDPQTARYLRLMLPVCGLKPTLDGIDALRLLADMADAKVDKHTPAEKALSDLRDAKSNLETSINQVEAMALSSTALIGDIAQGKVDLVRLELIQPGLRHAWQSLTDFMDCGLSEIKSAIKHLSPSAPAAPAPSPATA
jgi:hypothetical protein